MTDLSSLGTKKVGCWSEAGSKYTTEHLKRPFFWEMKPVTPSQECRVTEKV